MPRIALLESKKATVAVFSSLIGLACFKLGLTTEQTALVVSPLIAYVPVQGTIDHQEKKNAGPGKPPPLPSA